ncbi:steryl-sulfatase-like [Anneissia japonica]|uniref:steryl-sulfatase-like n=1 Tax=Anneissia japonica TaxID=1529436 RepID=UPI001425B865|nr:steryl-sulfatase-like [Anneissia japonica]
MPVLIYIMLVTIVVVRNEAAAATRKPNIVILLADDIGYGDIGCFGNTTIRTPHIDSLAKDGAMLTHHLATPLCSPSRAGLMTGRYPIRSGMVSFNMLRIVPFINCNSGLPPNESTVAELALTTGYKTGLIGKWHLGHACDSEGNCSHPNGQGFNYFYGLPLTNLKDCGGKTNVFIAWDAHIYRDLFLMALLLSISAIALYRHVYIDKRSLIGCLIFTWVLIGSVYYFINSIQIMNCILMENQKVLEQPLTYDNLTQRLTNRAISFMERHQEDPFFLFMSYPQAHTELFASETFQNQSKHGRYGDAVEEMDWSIGEVLGTIDKLGLRNNTFVYFTSDNGGFMEERGDDGERQGGYNGPFKGGKANTWEGGMRVPTIVRYPGVVRSNSIISQPTHVFDMYPTIASILDTPLPSDRVIDGKDLLPLLNEQNKSSPHEFMFHYCGGYLHGVRYIPKTGNKIYKVMMTTTKLNVNELGERGCWKTYVCQCYGSSVEFHNPPLVFDITTDLTEDNPLDSNDPEIKEIIQKSLAAVDEHKRSLTPVPNQFHPLRLVPIPWQQPCCGTFPFCSCKEDSNINSDSHILKPLPRSPITEELSSNS